MRVISALFFLSTILLGCARADLSGEETKTLDQLYQDAIKEGGQLMVYHGGDTAGRQNGLRDAFMKVFSKINTTIIVDYSKYQDVRLDNQFATNDLVPDVVALQTLQDFPRWKDEGHLLNYKPANFSKIYDGFKDPNGAWYGYSVYAFTSTSNATTLSGLPVPKTPLEIVDPMYKGLIASSYPNDDDAVLFLFSKYVEKYGWEWAAKFATQNVSFNRGTFVQGDLVRAGTKAIGVGGGGNHAAAVAGGYPFLAWAQRLAILKKAKNVAAAKLFVNWLFTEERQRAAASTGWTVRTDIPTTNGFPQVWDIENANVAKFAPFMADRERVEILKQTFALYFGEVQGAPTPGWPGLYPGRD